MINQITEYGLLPMYITEDFEVLKRTVELCSSAGLTSLEILNRVPNAFDSFIRLKAFIDEHVPGFSLIVGTVTDLASTNRYIDAGATMIIAPNLDEEIGAICIERGIEWLPGVQTISEIYKAKKIGARSVKLFPANLISPDFVKTIKSVLPEMKLIASGGIRLNGTSVTEWINSGVDAVAFGNGFFSKEILVEENFNHLKKEIQNTITQIQILRTNQHEHQ